MSQLQVGSLYQTEVCRLCISSATITGDAIGHVAILERDTQIPTMAMAIIRVIIVMDLPSFLVSEDIISIQAMGLAVTGSEAMDLEGTDLEGTEGGTEGGTIGEHSSRPKKSWFSGSSLHETCCGGSW